MKYCSVVFVCLLHVSLGYSAQKPSASLAAQAAATQLMCFSSSSPTLATTQSVALPSASSLISRMLSSDELISLCAKIDESSSDDDLQDDSEPEKPKKNLPEKKSVQSDDEKSDSD